MKQKPIFFVFRRSIGKALYLIKNGLHPDDFYYGFYELSKHFDLLSSDRKASAFTQKIQFGVDSMVQRIMDIGFSIIPTFFLISQARSSRLVFSTADAYGLPLALYKKLGFFTTPFIYNTVGLYDGLIKKNNPIAKWISRQALSSVELIIAGGSYQECTLLSKLLDIPLIKFKFVPFGIDTTFFKPIKTKEKNSILTIGADKSRDWDLFLHIASLHPNEHFHIIARKGSFDQHLPSNVTLEWDLSAQQVRERIVESKFIIVLSKLNFHFGGQSTIMRCMSCAKPVIFTHTPGVEEYKFENRVHCIIVKIGDKKAIQAAIQFLNKSPKIRTTMGEKARQIIVKHYSIKSFAKEMSHLFLTITKERK